MAITLGTNIASLQAQRRLGDASDKLSATFEKLSSAGQAAHWLSPDHHVVQALHHRHPS